MIIISNIINRTKNINTEWFVFVAELQENWAGKKEPIRKALEVKKGNSSIGKKKYQVNFDSFVFLNWRLFSEIKNNIKKEENEEFLTLDRDCE